MMIAIPAVFFIDTRQQELFIVERLQQTSASRNSCHRFTKRTMEPVKNSSLKKKLDNLVGLGRKRVVEVGGYLLRRPRERIHDPGWVRRISYRYPRKLQRGRPAFGRVIKLPDLRRRQFRRRLCA